MADSAESQTAISLPVRILPETSPLCHSSYAHWDDSWIRAISLVSGPCILWNDDETQVSSESVTAPAILYSPMSIEKTARVHDANRTILRLTICDNLKVSERIVRRIRFCFHIPLHRSRT